MGGLFWAASHLVPNPFGPRTFGPPQLVPKNKQSRLIWSPWTNGPQDNWSPWTIGPQTFGPHGQMVPQKLVPMDNWSPKFFDIGRSTLDIMDDFKPKNIFMFH